MKVFWLRPFLVYSIESLLKQIVITRCEVGSRHVFEHFLEEVIQLYLGQEDDRFLKVASRVLGVFLLREASIAMDEVLRVFFIFLLKRRVPFLR